MKKKSRLLTVALCMMLIVAGFSLAGYKGAWDTYKNNNKRHYPGTSNDTISGSNYGITNAERIKIIEESCNAECGWIVTERGVMNLLDSGILVEYIEEFKAKGYIPQYYQHRPWKEYPRTSELTLIEMYDNGVDFSPVFNLEWYTTNVRTNLSESRKKDEALIFKNYFVNDLYRAMPGHPNFDVEAYIEYNPDLYAAYGNDLYAYIIHYIEHGQYENRVTIYPTGVK